MIIVVMLNNALNAITKCQVVLQQAWASHMDTLKGALEKTKVDAEQKIAELSSSNTELCSKLAVYTEETERGQSALQMYREQVSINFDIAPSIYSRQDQRI